MAGRYCNRPKAKLCKPKLKGETMTSDKTAKLAYETPILECHGSMEALTQGASTGTLVDAVFPRGTPITDLTFS